MIESTLIQGDPNQQSIIPVSDLSEEKKAFWNSVIVVNRSKSGDDGVYFITHLPASNKGPMFKTVLKASENHIAEVIGGFVAKKLGFLVPDMRGIQGEELELIRGHKVINECVNAFNKKIVAAKSEVVVLDDQKISSAQGSMADKKPLDLQAIHQMILMTFIDSHDMTIDNVPVSESVIEQDDRERIVSDLSKLLLIDIALANYDRFCFYAYKEQLFPDIDKDFLWGNLGNILFTTVSNDDGFDINEARAVKESNRVRPKQLVAIDTITTLPQNTDQYINSLSVFFKRLTAPSHPDYIDDENLAILLKLDDILANGFFTGYGYENRKEFGQMARASIIKHANTMIALARNSESLKKDLILYMEQSQLLMKTTGSVSGRMLEDDNPITTEQLRQLEQNINFMVRAIDTFNTG